ncbi:MAG: hypothetical protein O2955_21425 [Planctomycetota bacterium]|nr:hypothetical protein [Planctomycetota bacterium]MDA1215070.1 hypothetical protein [Planctomycetota bacterium]
MDRRTIKRVFAWGFFWTATLTLPLSSLAEDDGWFISSEERASRRQRAWEEKAMRPVGARQKTWYGKLWPIKPRPTGPNQPLVHRYHAAHYWPLPYICEDRAYIKNLSDLQVAGGWVTATTLYDYHFDPVTNELNRAGEIHLRWILENTPAKYRMTFVQNSGDSTFNQHRLESVQAQSVQLMGEGATPPVMLRVTSPLSRPAVEIVNIHRADLETMPPPRITGVTGGGSADGGDGN